MARRFIFYTHNERENSGYDSFGLGVSVMVEEGEDPLLVLKARCPEKVYQACVGFELYETGFKAWLRLHGQDTGMAAFVEARLNEISPDVCLVLKPGSSAAPPATVVGPRKPPRLMHVSDFIAKLNEDEPGELARRAWEATKNVGKGT